MSLSFPNLVLPKGLAFNYKKSPKFSTILQTPQSMQHPATATLQQSTVWELELVFNYLKVAGVTFTNDVQQLQEFYEAMRGGYGWFTFDPSQFNLDTLAVTNVTTANSNGFFGIADGVTTTWQLWRSTAALGSGTVTLCEMIQDVTLLSGVYVNGTLTTVTLNQFPATVTFSTAPASGATLAWAGSYRYLCRFAEDQIDFNEFLYNLWELKTLRLETILL